MYLITLNKTPNQPCASKVKQPANQVTSTKVLTPRDIADILGISYDSALAFIKNSGIDYVCVGRQYRVSEDKLKAFLSQGGCVAVNLS